MMTGERNTLLLYATPGVEMTKGTLSTELLLVRHGTTDRAGELCGHLDPPLNAAGLEQAASLGQLLEGRKIGRLYASDLRRALQTAEFVSSISNIPIQVREHLREMSFGCWEGRRWSELKASLGGKTIEASPDERLPGGESYAAFRSRAVRALGEIIAGLDASPTVVVAHMGVIRIAVTEWSKTPGSVGRAPSIEPCGVYRFVLLDGVLTFTGQLVKD